MIWETLFICALLIISIFILICVVAVVILLFQSDRMGAPFVDNKDDVIKFSVNLLNLRSGDHFCDLGSGSGKVLKYVHNKYPEVFVTGIEGGIIPYYISKFRFGLRMPDKVAIDKKDIRDIDLSKYNKIYVYLFPKLLGEITDHISNAIMINNAMCVSCVFPIPNLNPSKIEHVYHPTFRKNIKIYIYGNIEN